MALFEAPASHEANSYNNPYAVNPEFENEWETSMGNPYANPEFENEWEMQESYPYSNPEYEWGTQESHLYSNPEYEFEMQEAYPYSNPEYEFEMQEAYPSSNSYANPYTNSEFEDEGEYFFKKAFRTLGRGIKAAAKAAAPLAKQLAPKIAGSLAGMIPGAGVVAGPLAAKLTSAMVQEGEMEAAQMEAAVFGSNEMEAEVSNTEVAHEAALTEFLAAQAAEATTEAEAEAAIAATLPMTIRIMGGRNALRRVTPVMVQVTGQMTKMMRQQGPAGKQLLRTIPSIQRRAVSTLKAASRDGQPVNNATAVKAMANATHRVLNNPQAVNKAIARNATLRQRTAPPNPRRAAAAMR
jgi:hypothetical protein